MWPYFKVPWWKSLVIVIIRLMLLLLNRPKVIKLIWFRPFRNSNIPISFSQMSFWMRITKKMGKTHKHKNWITKAFFSRFYDHRISREISIVLTTHNCSFQINWVFFCLFVCSAFFRCLQFSLKKWKYKAILMCHQFIIICFFKFILLWLAPIGWLNFFVTFLCHQVVHLSI